MNKRKSAFNDVFIKPKKGKIYITNAIVAIVCIFATVCVCMKVMPSIADKPITEGLLYVMDEALPAFSRQSSITAEKVPEADNEEAEVIEDDEIVPPPIPLSEPWSYVNDYALYADEQLTSETFEEGEIPADATAIREMSLLMPTNPKLSAEGVYINNNTTYDLNPSALLNGLLQFNFDDEGPRVLIVHTHSSESYTPTGKNYYLPTDPDRTEDTRYNVVRVGDEMARVLTEKGISVVHDRTINDYPSYNGSYTRMLSRIKDYLEEYPSIKVVIDVHRDAVTRDNEMVKLCSTIDGNKVAQVMLISGTNQAGLPNDNWQDGLTFAMKYQREMNKLYPGLARPVFLAKERYNCHTTKASFILEVGTSVNTLEEAIAGAELAADALGELLLRIK